MTRAIPCWTAVLALTALTALRCGGPASRAPVMPGLAVSASTTSPDAGNAVAETRVIVPVPVQREAALVEVLDASPFAKDDINAPTLGLYPMEGRTFVTLGDRALSIEGDILKSDPALQAGLSTRALSSPFGRDELGAMGGHFPGAAWIQYNTRYEVGYAQSMVRWTGTSWGDSRSSQIGYAFRIVPLRGSWSLIEESPIEMYSRKANDPFRVSAVHPEVRGVVRGAGLEGIPDLVNDLVVLDDGSVYVWADHTLLAWGPDGKRLAIPSPILPPCTNESVYLVSPSPTQIFLFQTGRPADEVTPAATPRPDDLSKHLFQFDGLRWTEILLPVLQLTRPFPGPRGSLWFTVDTADQMCERSAAGDWSVFDVPASVESMWAAPGGDVWAVSGPKLLHSRPFPQGYSLEAVLPPRGLREYGRGCSTVAAILHDVPRATPEDDPFLDTVALVSRALGTLSRHASFFDVTHEGRRLLMLTLGTETQPSNAEKESAALNAVFKPLTAKIPGATPSVVCVYLPDGVQSARLVRGPAPSLAAPRVPNAPQHAPRPPAKK